MSALCVKDEAKTLPKNAIRCQGGHKMGSLYSYIGQIPGAQAIFCVSTYEKKSQACGERTYLP